MVAEREGWLIGEEELVPLQGAAQVHLELSKALRGLLHCSLKDDEPVLPLPLGATHRDVGIVQELLRRRARAGAMPTLAVSVRDRCGCTLVRRTGSLSASSRRSAISSGPASSESSSAITTNSSPPTRPSVATAANAPSGIRRAALDPYTEQGSRGR
jgi:hypothetical protein